MSSIDFLDYFLVKERLVDMSYRENLQAVRKGDPIDKVICDFYLAKKMIYQHCKSASSLQDLITILSDLENSIPRTDMAFNKKEFEKAWNITINEVREKFSAYDPIDQ